MNKKTKYIGIVLVIIIAIIVIVIIQKNTPIKPLTTYSYGNYNQYSNDGDNNNVTTEIKNNFISKVIKAKNINGFGFDTTPIISGDSIYIGTMNKSNMTGNLLSVNRFNFNVNWNDHFSNWVMTNPVVVASKSMVYIGTGNSIKYKLDSKGNVLYRGLGSNYIYGISIDTGKIMWKYKTPGEDMPTPVYSNNTLYFANGNKEFYALNAQTGKLEWKINIGSIVSMSSLLLIGNNIYFGGASPYTFFDVNINTHKIQWSDVFPKITGGLDDTTPTYSNGYVYTNATRLTGQTLKNQGYEYLYKINASTGKIIWTINEGKGTINLPTDPMEGSVSTIVNNILYTSSNTSRRIFAVNVDTQKNLWSFGINSMINAPFIIKNNLIYAITTSGNIYLLNPLNGEFIAKRSLGGPEIASGLTLYNNHIYVATGNGNLYNLSNSNTSNKVTSSTK